MNSVNSAIWNMMNGGTGSISVNNHPMDDPRTRTSPATDVQVRVFGLAAGEKFCCNATDCSL